MTARETLRTIAAWVTLPAPPEPRAAAEYAAALRTLANRMDAEYRYQRETNGQVASAVATVILARLDAPLDQPCPHGHRYEDCCWKGRAPLGTPEVPSRARCFSWCSDTVPPPPEPTVVTRIYSRSGQYYCSSACRDAGRPLHPATPGER